MLFNVDFNFNYFLKGAKETGCFNTICPGFIQVSPTDPLSGPLPQIRDPKKRYISVSIQQVIYISSTFKYKVV